MDQDLVLRMVTALATNEVVSPKEAGWMAGNDAALLRRIDATEDPVGAVVVAGGREQLRAATELGIRLPERLKKGRGEGLEAGAEDGGSARHERGRLAKRG